MSVRLVDEIVTSFESLGFQHRAAMAVCSDRQCRDMRFAQCWQKIYADAVHDATLLRSPAVQEKIVRRLFALGRLMRERCWDFAIAKRLPVEDAYMAVAVRLLAHACAHHQEELRFCLNRSRPLFPTVAKRHNELFAEIELELSTGLPCTLALSQAEMARRSASVTTRFAATCVPVIGGPSRPMPSSTGATPAVAARHGGQTGRALERIRRRFRRILWSNLPAERGHRRDASRTW